MSDKISTKNYGRLLTEVKKLIEVSRKHIVREVNSTLTMTYWSIGKYLVEYEQDGEERAEYGSKLLKSLSDDLVSIYGKGFSERNLERMRNVYLLFGKSSTALTKLSWSHLLRLSSIKDSSEREFYSIEAIENNWSVRELDRQVNSSLYERLSLSRDKKKVRELATKGQKIQEPVDALKDPYVLEFLNLKEDHRYSESDLESAIISNLQMFLLELGKGFSFIARQKRISISTDHFYIDLVFYNRLLQCFLLIDLKIGKITHQDLGQMQMYVNYYDREIKNENENSTVGMILCKENSNFVVKYTLPKDNNQIFAKEYKLYLPKKQELKKILSKYVE